MRTARVRVRTKASVAHTEWDNREAIERSTAAARRLAASGKRRRIDPTTCDREYSPAEVEFMTAMQAYKTKNCRPFPTWSEVLEVLTGLGYVRDGADAPAFLAA